MIVAGVPGAVLTRCVERCDIVSEEFREDRVFVGFCLVGNRSAQNTRYEPIVVALYRSAGPTPCSTGEGLESLTD